MHEPSLKDLEEPSVIKNPQHKKGFFAFGLKLWLRRRGRVVDLLKQYLYHNIPTLKKSIILKLSKPLSSLLPLNMKSNIELGKFNSPL